MITSLTGSNSYLLKTKLNELINSFVGEHSDLGVEKLNAEEKTYQQLIEAVQAMPFLVTKKLVVIDHPSANKELSEKIKELLAAVYDETDVIFVESKFDKRSILYKTLKKDTQLIEFNEMDENGLANWIVREAKDRGGSITSGDARYLIQRVGLNQLKISHEIDKLLSYQPVINRQTIDLLSQKTPQSSIFDLLDSALSGNRKRAIELYNEQRQMKIEPIAILALLSWQLHILALVKSAGERSVDTIAKEAKINPFVVRKTYNLAGKLSAKQVRDLISETLKLDLSLKTKSIDADEAMQNLLMFI